MAKSSSAEKSGARKAAKPKKAAVKKAAPKKTSTGKSKAKKDGKICHDITCSRLLNINIKSFIIQSCAIEPNHLK